MGDTNTSGVIGVKTEDDIEQQTTATGPVAYGYRQQVKEGAKHGYRGEAEGLVEVRDATERAQVKAETRIAQRSGDAAVGIKVRPSREPDYLKGERPNVSADAGKGEGLGSKTRAELDQIAAAEGVDVSDAKNKGDVVSAIERARAASSPPQPETE